MCDTTLLEQIDELRSELSSALCKDNNRLLQIFTAADADHSSFISSGEFLAVIRKLVPAHIAKPELSNALFEMYDPDGTGTIDYRELGSMLKTPARDFARLPRSKSRYLAYARRRRPVRYRPQRKHSKQRAQPLLAEIITH